MNADVKARAALAEVIGLGVMAMVASRRSAVLAAAVVFLLGTTSLGYLLGAFLFVPIATGYASHDTTPWAEAFAAVCTMTAAVAACASRRAQPSVITPI